MPWVYATDCTLSHCPEHLTLYFLGTRPPCSFMVASGTAIQVANLLPRRSLGPSFGIRNSAKTSNETKQISVRWLRLAGAHRWSGNVSSPAKRQPLWQQT